MDRTGDGCIDREGGEGRQGHPTVPIAFVSEHIETLVELDIEYRHLAEKLGAKHYIRAPALGVDEGFIGTLADLVEEALADAATPVRSSCGGRICPTNWRDCPNRRLAATKAA